MKSTFWIQAGRPRTTGRFDAVDSSLAEAFDSVFTMNSESIMMVWNGVYVPIGYKYDFGIMIDDVLLMCDAILASSIGEMRIDLASNTFHASWRLNWKEGSVSIEAVWRNVLGGVVGLLSPVLVVPIDAFLAEWKQPLRVCRDALVEAGYDPVRFPRLGTLDSTFGAIGRFGILY